MGRHQEGKTKELNTILLSPPMIPHKIILKTYQINARKTFKVKMTSQNTFVMKCLIETERIRIVKSDFL